MDAIKPILILQTGDAPEEISQDHGNYDGMFLAAAGLRPEQVDVVYLPGGQRPGNPEEYSGVLITGSSAMVTERLDWSEAAAAWLRQAMTAEVPIFGVCYGHQLLAHALGGEVDYHPQGIEIGTLPIELTDDAAADPLLTDFTQRFEANLIHSQTVLTPPPGAEVLAGSRHDPHQILRYRPDVMTTQFHPEFDAAIMQRFLMDMIHSQPEREAELGVVGKAITDTPASRSLMAAFVQRYMLS